MSCNRRVTTHIYLTPTDGSAGKVFPADIFGLPNVKVDKQKNTVTIKGKEYSLQNMEEIKDGRYNDFLQQKQFMQTAKQQITSQNNEQIEQVKQEILQAKNEATAENLKLLERAKIEMQNYYDDLIILARKVSTNTAAISQTDEKINTAKSSITAETEGKITAAKNEVKSEIARQRTQEITAAKEQVKNEVTRQRNQQIQQTKNEIARQRNQQIQQVKNEITTNTTQKIAQAKQQITNERNQAIQQAKNELTNTCTVKIQEVRQELEQAKSDLIGDYRLEIGVAKHEINTQRAQEIQQAKAELAAQIRNASSGSFSIGDYKHSAQTSDQNGWLLCDGRAIDRTTYSALFAIIGTSFGNGNTRTTFNLPDARGRVCVAEGQITKVNANYPMAETGGQNFITLTEAQLPPHAHQVRPHTHTYNTLTVGGEKARIVGHNESPFVDRAINNWNYTGRTHNSGEVWTTNTGARQPIDVKQPYIVVGRLFIFSGVI